VYRVGHETLSHIALKTGVSVTRLKTMNELKDDQIREDTGLLVPDTELTAELPPWEPPLPSPGWKECASAQWVDAVESPSDRCVTRFCAGEACWCENEPGDALELSFGKVSWPSEGLMVGMSDPSSFRHARVDLDGDGEPESVLSTRFATGNGIGVETWTHTVISAGRPVASFTTVDHGWSFVELDRGCAFLAVRIEERRDPLRGWGLYWTARLHALRGGAMRALPEPAVTRRYTHRFATERATTLDSPLAHPVPWFGASAFVPAPEVPPSHCRSASIVFEDDEGRFDLGSLGVFERRGWHEPGDAAPLEYDELRDGVTGAPLLEDYRPFGDARWTGRKATVCDGVVDGERRVILSLD
jgi:hypothetical protein